MSFPDLGAMIFWLEIAGVAVFAASGALTAARKQMDLGGFALIATVTGIGGGTVRDLLTGAAPVFWIAQPVYPLVCIVTAFILFFAAPLFESRYKALVWADAAGLALFCATGAEAALKAGTPAVAAIIMGVISATFGGIVRDVLSGEIPLILRKEIYATAAAAGAALYTVLRMGGVDILPATIAAFAVCFMLRAFSIAYGVSLPVYDKRPARDYPDKPAD